MANAATLDDLPDEVRELIAPHVTETPATLAAISLVIAKKRDEAKTARASSGIEQTWSECEDAYLGIDDANRGEFKSKKWHKPPAIDGPVTVGNGAPPPDHKSTVFVPLTARYVDAGSAKLGEILLPIDDKAFSFTETPVPELVKAKEDATHVHHDGMLDASGRPTPLYRPAKEGEAAPTAPSPTAAPPAALAGLMPTPAPVTTPAGAAAVAAPPVGAVPPGGAVAPPGMVPLRVKDLAEEALELARKKAKKAETRIYDWMVECQRAAEVRKVIFDSARIGVGILKGPFPKASQSIALGKQGGGVTIEVKERISPASKWIDAWNFFPDPACGENIHEGDYVLERDHLSERQLRGLKKIPGYIGPQIDKVLREGPGKINLAPDNPAKPDAERKDRYEVWYWYGMLTGEEMDCIAAAASGKSPDSEKKREVYVIATLINDTVIRATINPLDSGAFPYHPVPWRRRAGLWAGIGVGEQIAPAQKMLNAATRAMLNNAGMSAGVQIVVDLDSIIPADGTMVMAPLKVWYKKIGSSGDDVRKAFEIYEIPNATDALLKIIGLAQQLAEESTSIPLVTQGQSGATTPDTYGATQLQNNNANQLLRAIGYAFDDYCTEPETRQYYEYLLLDPEVPDDEKGDFTINAHGSAALVERAIQDQTIAQLLPLSVQMPALGYDPKRLGALYLKSKRIDPKDAQYSEDEQAKIAAAPPPAAPAVQVAQIAAVTKDKELAAEQASEQRAEQVEIAVEAHRIRLGEHKIVSDTTVGLHELQLKRELAMLDYANKHSISLDGVNAELAKTAMTLQAQKELNAADNAVALHKHRNAPRPERPSRNAAKPLAQVPGKAANGHAFDQGPAQ